MKVINKYSLLLLAGFMIFTGCKKQLDKQPTDSFSDENAFQTMEHIQMGVNAAYGRYSAYFNDIYLNALLSDEAKLGVGNAGQGALTYRLQYNSDGTAGGDVTAPYYSYYRMIDQINRVLPHIDNVGTAEDEPRKKVLRGQLLALRAIGHFSLLEFYADRYDAAKPGVPIMTKSCVTCKPSRNTMGEVMTQIEKDLNDALGLLPAVTAANFSDTVMNALNIKAYQARIALYKRDYQAAADYATAVISSGIRPLTSGPSFTNTWTADAPGDVLFRRRYSTTNDGAIGAEFTTTGGTIYIAPSTKLVNSYDNNDIRKSAYIGETAAGDVYLKKYHDAGKGGRVADIKAIRMAEMYLIRAEAYAKLGGAANLQKAADDINDIRRRRIPGYVDVTFASTDVAVDEILQERFKELAFEGFRWFDLKRNNLPLQRDPADANEEWRTLAANSYLWLLPIPRSEILATGGNTTQNLGYNN